MTPRPRLLRSAIAALAGLPLAASAAGPPPSSTTPASQAAEEPLIAVKESPPVRIAFDEHQGPYWTLGPVMEIVRAAMASMNEDGPMFVRFHGDPRHVPATELKSDIGFVVDGGAVPPEPLRMGRRAAEKVAYLLAPGPYGTTSRFYPRLYAWAEKNGLAPRGGLIEVYWGSDSKSAIEIQITVAEVVPPEAGAIDLRLPPPPSEPPQRAEPPAGVDAPAAEPTSQKQPPPDADRDLARNPSRETSLNQPSVSKLFADRQFDGLAETVLPTGAVLDEQSQVFAAQMAYRLLAVGRGLEHRFADEGRPAKEAAEALLERLRRQLPDGSDALALASQASSLPTGSKERALLRRVDLLLGRMALGTAGLEQANREVVEMLQTLAETLREPE